MGADPLLLHLHKLPPAAAAEEPLAEVLETLWNTKKTGLGSLQKPSIQSLLGLTALQDLDPTRMLNQVKVDAPTAPTSSPVSELSSSLWPRQDDATSYPNSANFSSSIPSYGDSNLSDTGPTPLHRDNGSFHNLLILPRLRSMTWTMEKLNSKPANRVAIITLKLQDHTKSPSGEIEVKFQLSKDTLEAMLRSMTYLSEQLSNSVVPPSEPSSKKQRLM